MRYVDSGGLPWFKAVEICREKYRSMAEYGSVIPNCRKRTEDEAQYTFVWNSSVPIIFKNEHDKEIKNIGTCVVLKETGKISYISLNNRVVENAVDESQ